MTQQAEHDPLAALGWQPHFADQLSGQDAGLLPMRVATVHRARLTAMSPLGSLRLELPHHAVTADFAVGDWVLAQPETRFLIRRLDRRTLLQRHTEGGRGPQLIAANADALFIVSSCNEDLNVARLERYLALANEAGMTPVIVLTKADRVADTAPFLAQVNALQRGLAAVALNAKSPEAAAILAPWCGPGQTVALVGSSGVGKSSLLNTLSWKSGDAAQPTGDIREADAKGRHTTTSRSLHPIRGGGLVIDTPGMRGLSVADAASGVHQLFAEITELSPLCRFRNCTHDHEPGCAVRAAVAAGALDPERLRRFRKLQEELAAGPPPPPTPRGGKPSGRRRPG